MNEKRIVVIPTYNEVENIENVVEKIMALSLFFDILIVDDNSPDGTAEKVKNLQHRFSSRIYLEVRKEKRGLGGAYVQGLKKSLSLGYEYIFEMDADMSHNPEDLIRLYKACQEEDCDFSIGSRYVNGVNVINWPMKRVLVSYCASIYVKMITRMPINDPTAGFVCYHRNVLESLNLDKIKFIGYAFQIEMKYKAWKKKFKFKEVSIIFIDRKKGESKMSMGIFAEAAFAVIYLKIQYLFSSAFLIKKKK